MDHIDTAVAAVAAGSKAEAEKRTFIQQTLEGTFVGTERPFLVTVPRDITPKELGALVELLMGMRLASDRAGQSPIVRATTLPT